MSAKHTPGPWVVVVNSRGAAVAIDAPSVANIPGETKPVRHNGIGSPHSAKGHANARLIASAPDLLDALLDTLDFLERHSNRWDGVNGKHPQVVVTAARAAIAKATGAPQ